MKTPVKTPVTPTNSQTAVPTVTRVTTPQSVKNARRQAAYRAMKEETAKKVSTSQMLSRPRTTAHNNRLEAVNEVIADDVLDQWQQVTYFEITEHQEGQRLDNFLINKLKGVPKSRIYRLVREAEVRVNKGRAKVDRRLMPGDIVRIAPIKRQVSQNTPIPDANISDSLAEGLASRIVFEDEGLIVLNKPAGLAVHGGSGIAFGVIEALRQALDKPHLELVHRLDRDTSGLLMISQKRSMLKRLQDDLRVGRIQKTYQALVKGVVLLDKQMVNAPLLRYELPNGERRVRVTPSGKDSQTEFKVIQRFAGATLVEAKPLTGRTHQIRVHGLYLGHPLVGDDKYGHDRVFKGAEPKRLCLHAARLEIPGYPAFTADLPEDIQYVITQITSTSL